MKSIGRSLSNADRYPRSEDHFLASMHIDREDAIRASIRRKASAANQKFKAWLYFAANSPI